MEQPRFELGADVTSTNAMGFAWCLVREKYVANAQVIVMHVGDVDGHSSGLYLDPTEKIGVIVLQNLGGNDGEAAIDHLGFWLEELAGGRAGQVPIVRARPAA
jgi:hypothetical protein